MLSSLDPTLDAALFINCAAHNRPSASYKPSALSSYSFFPHLRLPPSVSSPSCQSQPFPPTSPGQHSVSIPPTSPATSAMQEVIESLLVTRGLWATHCLYYYTHSDVHRAWHNLHSHKGSSPVTLEGYTASLWGYWEVKSEALQEPPQTTTWTTV